MNIPAQNHVNMLCDMSDIAALLAGSDNIGNFLERTVVMVGENLAVPVCSIYLYDTNTDELVLKATCGFHRHAVDRVRMKRGEGLVGTVMDTLNPIREGRAYTNKKFKPFEDLSESDYPSFLAVPIGRGHERIGVIVVQHKRPDHFSEADQAALRGIAAQLAGVIANARLLMSLERKEEQPVVGDLFRRVSFVKGRSASGGYAFGLTAPVQRRGALRNDNDGEDGGANETASIREFYRALETTSRQLQELQDRLFKSMPEAVSLLFEAHQMILKDEGFSRRVAGYAEEGVAVEEAVRMTARHYRDMFASSSYDYLREKADDVEDLALRIIENLRGVPARDTRSPGGRIVLAATLYPSDILRLTAEEAQGIILVGGGATSHVAILARSLRVPLVLTDEQELLAIPAGTPVLVDGDLGNVYVNPSLEVIDQFERRNRTRRSLEDLARAVTDESLTADGTVVEVMANINILGELPLARALKARGIGLYRTEFPFLVRSGLPSEEEQYRIYRHVFTEMAGRPVIIRALDLAGDKLLPSLQPRREENPQLGLRSIRFLLENRDIFEQQVRAILRAAAGADRVGILFPLISSIDEFEEVRGIVHDCLEQLQRHTRPCHPSPMLGPMIELPSLVEIIDELSERADFASIGTNDFVQYMLAADRSNDGVAGYYQPWHPAVLRALDKIVRAFTDRGKMISLCGELAADSAFLPFLVGIGLRVLSVEPRSIPILQNCLRHTDRRRAEDYAAALLDEATVAGVLARAGFCRNGSGSGGAVASGGAHNDVSAEKAVTDREGEEQ